MFKNRIEQQRHRRHRTPEVEIDVDSLKIKKKTNCYVWQKRLESAQKQLNEIPFSSAKFFEGNKLWLKRNWWDCLDSNQVHIGSVNFYLHTEHLEFINSFILVFQMTAKEQQAAVSPFSSLFILFKWYQV